MPKDNKSMHNTSHKTMPIANASTATAYSGEVKKGSAGKSESGVSPTANTITSKGRRVTSTRRRRRKKA